MLGTPRKITQADTGNLVWTWLQDDPWGNNAPDTTNGIVYNLRYAGQYKDEETGLIENRNRFYDPTSGRYLNPDPIGLEGGLHRYNYVIGDPINRIDPLGLEVYLLGHIAANPLGYVTSPPSYHLSLLLKPDDPTTLGGISTYTLGGQPKEGKLISAPNYPGDAPENSKILIKVETPVCDTDKGFIRKLIRVSNMYDNNLDYSFPKNLSGLMPAGSYNSNSYVSGIIKAAGGTIPILPSNIGWQAPGYNNPIPVVKP